MDNDSVRAVEQQAWKSLRRRACGSDCLRSKMLNIQIPRSRQIHFQFGMGRNILVLTYSLGNITRYYISALCEFECYKHRHWERVKCIQTNMRC